MTWQDRQHGPPNGGSGGPREFFRRVFGDGENPLNWAVPVYTAWGIRVRIHIFFIVYVIAQLLAAIPQDSIGVAYMALGMFALFGTVLLHEYGHCFAARHVGGEADDILLWPLGGLATVDPPDDPRSHLITVLGGPAVNLVLWPILAGIVLLLTGGAWGAVFFNPFAPGLGMGAAQIASIPPAWITTLVWWLMYINALLLAFNMLVPMYPMDAGRTLHAILWQRLGKTRATRITVTVGLVSAGVLAVIAIVTSETLLLALAAFGGLTCWMERRRVRFESDPILDASEADNAAAEREQRRLEREAEKAEAEQAEIDRILAKISESGMGSLTGKEKRALERASGRKHDAQSPK